MRFAHGLVLFAALCLSACASLDGGKPAPALPAQGATFKPSGPIALGDYEKASDSSVRGDFSKEIVGRYAAATPVAAALKDLADNKFACAPPKQGTGDPPDQVCRRAVKAGSCTYTFQVHLFNDAGKAGVARVRGLYDKACGDELLGG
jgi:hypothetical protein